MILIAVVMFRVGLLFRTIISFIENQFLSEQIYDNRYMLKISMRTISLAVMTIS